MLLARDFGYVVAIQGSGFLTHSFGYRDTCDIMAVVSASIFIADLLLVLYFSLTISERNVLTLKNDKDEKKPLLI